MKKTYMLFLFILCGQFYSSAQERNDSTVSFTLHKAIELAQQQSPDVLIARHSFRSSFWNYCYYKANYLPSLTLTSSPNFDNAINSITREDGSTHFVSQNQLNTNARLSLSQNIPWTGGQISLGSRLQRIDLLTNDIYSYKSSPLVIEFRQSLFGYNSLKWDKKIEPLRFEEAKRSYVETLELVGARAISYFFSLASAQTNLEIAQTNYQNADTLYVFAQGRYGIGTITENEMLQLEVAKLTEESNRLEARWRLDDAMEAFRSYLGIKESYGIKVEIDEKIPVEQINVSDALEYALKNSPDILNLERRKIESESNLAYVKANNGIKTELYMELGLSQTSDKLSSAYQNLINQQYISLSLSVPILDWGRAKGRVEVARSNRDLEYARAELNQKDFERNVVKIVKQFNMQSSQMNVAAKTNYTSERRNDVARKLYLLGKSTILDLNASISEKDSAKRNYINTLYNYWYLYYMLRSMTLFDFDKEIPITEDYELLMK